MSKRHFKAVADILAGEYATSGTVAARAKVDAITRSLADLFISENPRFDRARFYAAVGIGMEPNLMDDMIDLDALAAEAK